jgi:transglutaminase-like putative cysteine protease
VDFTVTHVTRFRYQGPVYESVMEIRLGPRTDGRQEVQEFDLETNPAAAVFRYADAFGNNVHHFDTVPPHEDLLIQTRTRVRTSPARELPAAGDEWLTRFDNVEGCERPLLSIAGSDLQIRHRGVRIVVVPLH